MLLKSHSVTGKSHQVNKAKNPGTLLETNSSQRKPDNFTINGLPLRYKPITFREVEVCYFTKTEIFHRHFSVSFILINLLLIIEINGTLPNGFLNVYSVHAIACSIHNETNIWYSFGLRMSKCTLLELYIFCQDKRLIH